MTRLAMFAGMLMAPAMAIATAGEVTVIPASQAVLDKAGIVMDGKLVAARKVRDRAGEHLLVLTQSSGPSRTQPDNRVERTDLAASYYSRGAARWTREWVVQDGVDCPSLDHTGEFFPDQLSVTDLDHNGMAEVTVAYKLFCGGGVDPAVLKVILRQGEQKFAMRGSTRIVIPGQPPLGGEAVYDKALSAPANAIFKQHISRVRARVVVEKY